MKKRPTKAEQRRDAAKARASTDYSKPGSLMRPDRKADSTATPAKCCPRRLP